MQKVLYSIDDVKEKIFQGKKLLLAGDESELQQLPSGHWIGGTTPYFMGESGGLVSKELIFVTEFPDYIEDIQIKEYDIDTISQVYMDLPANGFGYILIPAFTKIHMSFALNSPTFPEFATKPLLGWITGVLLDDLGRTTPKVFNGITGRANEDTAVVMFVSLPEKKVADIRILNIFKQGSGDTITFAKDGFDTRYAVINGTRENFSNYILDNKLDIQLPLVADYSGAAINISIKTVDAENHLVSFYAPVFRDVRYRFAQPFSDYFQEFMALVFEDNYGEISALESNTDNIFFSCNCILNYLYSGLEGRRTGKMTGPITFGEIAYQLLNQTLIYLMIFDQP